MAHINVGAKLPHDHDNHFFFIPNLTFIFPKASPLKKKQKKVYRTTIYMKKVRQNLTLSPKFFL